MSKDDIPEEDKNLEIPARIKLQLLDITEHHDHSNDQMDLKTPQWYEFFGGKCPVCQAPAKFKRARIKYV